MTHCPIGSAAARRSAPRAFVVLAGAILALGCSSGDAGHAALPSSASAGTSGSRQDTSIGSVGLAITVAPGETVDTVVYTLTGPGNFSQTGSIDVSGSQSVSALLGSIPVGSGYVISLSGASTDSTVTCAGMSSGFAILPGQTTDVSVLLSCDTMAPEAGVLTVSATTSDCPVIDGLSAIPAAVNVGGSLQLTAAARGPNGFGMTYAWTAPSGTFSTSSGSVTTFTCTSSGVVVVSLVVGDGSDASNCQAAQTVTVTCM